MTKDKDLKHQLTRGMVNAARLLKERPEMTGTDCLSFMVGYLSGSFPDVSEAFEQLRDAARRNESEQRFNVA